MSELHQDAPHGSMHNFLCKKTQTVRVCVQVCVHWDVFTPSLPLSPLLPSPDTHPADRHTFFPRKSLCICGPVSNRPVLIESRRPSIKKRENHLKGSYSFAWFLKGFDSLQHNHCYKGFNNLFPSLTLKIIISAFFLSLLSFSVITIKAWVTPASILFVH